MKLPTWWYREEGNGLVRLQGGAKSGTSQAALRVYLAAAVIKRPVAEFEVSITLDWLEEVTRLSRSIVVRGLKGAQELGLIDYEPGRSGSRITLVRHNVESAGGWAKLPTKQAATLLPRIPHRGEIGLAALKIYMTLIAARPNENRVVRLAHTTLRAKTGCKSGHVRAAITLLANAGLLHVVTDDGGDGVSEERRCQSYELRGSLEAKRNWAGAHATLTV